MERRLEEKPSWTLAQHATGSNQPPDLTTCRPGSATHDAAAPFFLMAKMAVFHEQARAMALSTDSDRVFLPHRGVAASLDTVGAAMPLCVIGSSHRRSVLPDF